MIRRSHVKLIGAAVVLCLFFTWSTAFSQPDAYFDVHIIFTSYSSNAAATPKHFYADSASGSWNYGSGWGVSSSSGSIGGSSISATDLGILQKNNVDGSHIPCNYWNYHAGQRTIDVYVRGTPGTSYCLDIERTGTVSAQVTGSNPDGCSVGQAYSEWEDVSAHAIYPGSDANNISDNIQDQCGVTTGSTITYQGEVYSFAYSDSAYAKVQEMHGKDSNISHYIKYDATTNITVTVQATDTDNDGVLDDGNGDGTVGNLPCPNGQTQNCDDNCINDPNGPDLGTCTAGDTIGVQCTNNSTCGAGGFCSMKQEDTDTDGIGDACENQSPIADFIFDPPQPLVNEIVTFDASSSSDPDGYITDWDWEFETPSGPVTKTGENVDFAWSDPGLYQVALTVTDDEGWTNNKIKFLETIGSCEVEIEGPNRQFNADGEPEFHLAVSEVGSFSAEVIPGSANDYDYDWYFSTATGDGYEIRLSQGFQYAWQKCGEYTISVVATWKFNRNRRCYRDGVVFIDPLYCDRDSDGVPDLDDLCLGTALGVNVDDYGCSGEQLVDLACPCDNAWDNHGQYVSSVAHAAKDQFLAGLITQSEKDVIVSARAERSCGQK